MGTPLGSFRAYVAFLQLRRISTFRRLNLCHISFKRESPFGFRSIFTLFLEPFRLFLSSGSSLKLLNR